MTGIPVRINVAAALQEANEAWLLRERIRGLISDFLRPAGTGLPEPVDGRPPQPSTGPISPAPSGSGGPCLARRGAAGFAPTPTSGPQTSSRRGARTNADGSHTPPVEAHATEARSWRPVPRSPSTPALGVQVAEVGMPSEDGRRFGPGAEIGHPFPATTGTPR